MECEQCTSIMYVEEGMYTCPNCGHTEVTDNDLQVYELSFED